MTSSGHRKNSKRLGVFGGTFDPIHVGHLVAALNAKYACALDEVLFVVAGEPWQKTGTRTVTPAESRFRAVQAALTGLPGLEASRLEIDRTGPSYTADTLQALRDYDPSAELFLILGTDAAANLETWTAWEAVSELAEVIVVSRPASPTVSLGRTWRMTEVEMPELDISSTDLRRRLAEGRPVEFLIPEAAREVIAQAGDWSF